MDPTIEAAWIGAAVGGGVGVLGIMGTVVTSAVSSRNTRKATEETVAAGTANTRAALAAAREDRHWEKRSAAYEETVAGLLHRQLKRRHDLRGHRWDEGSGQQLRAFFEGYEPPGWFQVQSRLAAYASDPVMAAFKATSEAHAEVWARYQRYSTMADGSERAAETLEALEAIDRALKDAEAKDEVLIQIIRGELWSAPEAATLPAARSVKRPRLAHRRARSADE